MIHLRLTSYTVCQSKQHLYNLFSDMVAKSAEGIIVKDPSGLYVPGLSKQVFKFRAAKHQKALLQKKLGQYAWLCWVPVVQQNNDYSQATMLVDQKSIDLADSLQEGDIVEYRYYYHTSLNSGFTVNPVIYCKRPDLTWEQVCNQKQIVIAKARRIFWRQRTTSSWATHAERRNFFVELAEELGFNPYIAPNWYSIPRSPIIQKQGGISILQYHNNSYVQAIVDLFPELHLDPDLFANYSREKDTWTNSKDRRAFLDKLAQHMHFDPLVAENWERVSVSDVVTRGGRLVLKHHHGSLLVAVKDLYPELNFRPDLGVVGYWEDVDKQRRFFDELASELKFDPLVSENWLQIKVQDVLNKRGGNKIISLYGNSHIHALIEIYSEIDLSCLLETDWTAASVRRDFLDSFAASNAFDPLVVDNWYTISKKDILAKVGGSAVLQYHGQSHIQALINLYPDLKFSLHKFSKAQQNHWDDPATHRTFFDDLAKEGYNGRPFDPLIAENWYSLTHNQVVKRKGGTSIIKQYSNSFIDSLIHVYPEVIFKRERFNKTFYWTSSENCRAFFDEFALENNFDPLMPHNWYSVSSTDIRAKKCGASVLRHYKYSHVQALLTLYPEVRFDTLQFNVKAKRKVVAPLTNQLNTHTTVTTNIFNSNFG